MNTPFPAAGRPLISLCMIVRDEASCLARALRSVAPLCGDLVVVDTGSRDATPEIARAGGARVAAFTWRDDYAAARNFAIERARGAWVLALDADETVETGDLEAVRAAAEGGGAEAFRMMTRNYSGAQAVAGWVPCRAGEEAVAHGAPGWFPSWKIRLFRRRPGLRFTGRVHELVEPAAAALRVRVGTCGAPVHHYGYWEPNPAKAEKGRVYEALGRAKAGEAPAAKASYELGVQAMVNGRPAEAAAWFADAVRRLPGYVEASFALARALEMAGRAAEALEAYARVAALAPDHWECRLNRANLLWRQRRADDARAAYAEALAVGAGAWLVHFNYGVFAAGALGKSDRAREAFDRSRELNPFHAPTYRKLALLALERGDRDGARRALEEGLARCPGADDLGHLATLAGLELAYPAAG